MKIAQIILLSAGLGFRLSAAPAAPTDNSIPTMEWDFQHVENGQIMDATGKSVGKLEDATRGVVDATHACLEISKSTTSRVLLHPPKLSGKHLTISLWVKISKGATSLQILRSSNLSMGAYRSNAKMQFRVGTKFSDLNTYPDSRGIMGNGQWHSYTVTYDEIAGGKAVVYIDGIQIAEAALDGPPTKRGDSDSDIIIGSENPKNVFAGSIADIRVYDEVLSADQIHSNYEANKDVYVPPTNAPMPSPAASPAAKIRTAVGESADTDDSSDEPMADDQGTGKHMDGTAEVTPGDQALHAAWLNYQPAAPGTFSGDEAALLQNIAAPGADSTIRTAADELSVAITGITSVKPARGENLAGPAGIVLGTPETSPTISHLASQLQLQQAGSQGYILRSVSDGGTNCLIVAANSPAGVISGTFALIRRMQLGQSLTDLNVVDVPKTAVRLVNHWDFIPDSGDQALKGRNNSIYSWADLRAGHTALIREWARLLASAGYNGVCPTELNWAEGNNFLSHLDEVKTLAGIFRDYGIKLYWTPNYLLAPLPTTSDALYKAVPDFGGYLLKFGSEGQPGDPGPDSINSIARLLAPHGGVVLVRGFIYGKYSPLQDKLRQIIPYKFFGPLDGKYDPNVVIVGKSSPLDFEIREPINALDGVLKQTRYGTEVMITKEFPMSWIESWKRWFDFDNQRNGPGTYNRDGIDAVVGVAMVHPDVSWTANPLNMVNFYALGRLAWHPDLTPTQIQSEWIGMTFGPQSTAAPAVDHLLAGSDKIADDLMLYHGYRGVWVILRGGGLRTKLPYPQQITPEGIGGDGAGTGLSAAYAPGVRAYYENMTNNEDLLLFFHFLPYDYKLTNGRTLAEDMNDRLSDGVAGAQAMLDEWRSVDGKIDPQYFAYTTQCMESYATEAQKQEKNIEAGFATLRNGVDSTAKVKKKKKDESASPSAE
ncbi:MAG TPA: LamG-like jellyroll fold domain-containing protein [Verrucomicrobiae bacterium]|jgi:alpha-glucuronidase